jgi:hypothetical protein
VTQVNIEKAATPTLDSKAAAAETTAMDLERCRPTVRRTQKWQLRGPLQRQGRVVLALSANASAGTGPVRGPDMSYIFEDFLFLLSPLFCVGLLTPASTL